MERVRFVPPVSSNDLRTVLASHTAVEHDHYAVAFRTPFGEVRVINWLTKVEAERRGDALRKRGYVVVVGPMDIA